MNRSPAFAGILVFAAWIPAMNATAQDSNDILAQLLEENAYTLTVEAGQIAGVGADFLIDATANAQFFCFAEPHNVKDVPEAFTAIFRTLHARHGYEYAALETGPFIMDAASGSGVSTRREAVAGLYKQFPGSFHFYTDQELNMIADIGFISTAKSPAVWGVDQVHAVPVIVQRLMELVERDDVRERLLVYLRKISEHNRNRPINGDKYIFVENEGFAELETWLENSMSEESQFLLDQLRLSYNVYKDFRSNSTSPPRAYYSNYLREENMKDLFMRGYRRAEAAGDSLPKVVVKSGHWHLMRGKNPGNSYTFGNFLSGFAKSNGMDSFHVAVSIINEPGKYWSLSESEDMAAIAAVGSPDAWRIVDLRPLRPYAHKGALPGLTRGLRDWIFQYDAALLLGGATRGTYTIERERKRELHRTGWQWQ